VGGRATTRLVRPRSLRPGDKIAVVSPSYPAVGLFPHRVERGLAYLESLGLRPVIMPNAALVDGWTAGSAAERTDDLHAAFADDSIAAIICGIGGNHSSQLLPLLDFDLIAAHPKVFQGYSDITCLHAAFAKHSGLGTYYGPALCSELGEFPAVFPFTDRWLRAAWFEEGDLEFEPTGEWTDEFLDWNEKADLERPRELHESGGWVTIRHGAGAGPLVGGCLESLCWHTKGSPEWPDLDGVVLFVETSEEGPSPEHVDGYLTDLENLGVFEAISALVVGRPAAYAPGDVSTLWEVVERRTAASGIPVLANVDAGHTDPMLTLPLGATANVDAGARSFSVSR
jgi:muramoyltetrapeptide carboxypeptidase LdcA involved in peptidoglycan recycling